MVRIIFPWMMNIIRRSNPPKKKTTKRYIIMRALTVFMKII